MNNTIDPKTTWETEERELDAIAATLVVCSGLRAGVLPCI
jgi:hypothetical protein